MTQTPTYVDHAAIKTGQVLAMFMMLAAYISLRWEVLAALAIVFLWTAVVFPYGPFVLVYRLILKPLGLVKPDIRRDHSQPHRFGQAVGALSAALAAYLVYAGYPIWGWGLDAVLLVLTFVSFAGWCIGCFLYYVLGRIGLGGFFSRTPPDDHVALGARPRRNQG